MTERIAFPLASLATTTLDQVRISGPLRMYEAIDHACRLTFPSST